MGHIGILGVDKKGEEFYQLTLGGSGAEDAAVGQALGPALPYDRVADAVDTLVETYLRERQRRRALPRHLPAHRRRPLQGGGLCRRSLGSKDGAFALAEDPFTDVADDRTIPPGDVIISLTRFQAEGEALLAEGRAVGVRLESHEEVEALAYDLPRLAVVALAFPKFGDGRAYSSARLLRERFGFKGEVRAVGDVLREQAGFMVRCGFDAFEPADGSTLEAGKGPPSRFRHVYQRSADGRAPAFEERGG